MNEENKPLVKSVPSDVEKALSKIKTAWIAGVVIGSLSLIMLILSLLIKSIAMYSFTFLFLAIWVLGFSYGIYKKSRVCAIMMLAFWILGTLNNALSAESIGALVGAIICVPFYIGLRGTFAYYKLDTVTKMMHRE